MHELRIQPGQAFVRTEFRIRVFGRRIDEGELAHGERGVVRGVLREIDEHILPVKGVAEVVQALPGTQCIGIGIVPGHVLFGKDDVSQAYSGHAGGIEYVELDVIPVKGRVEGIVSRGIGSADDNPVVVIVDAEDVVENLYRHRLFVALRI